MDDKITVSFELLRRQQNLFSLLAKAEADKHSHDYTLASASYDTFIGEYRDFLDLNIQFRQQFSQPMDDVDVIVQPLVNGLLTHADIEEGLGKRDEANLLRDDALNLSEKYLGREGSIESARSRAAALTTEGRFNEALVAYMESRDHALRAGDRLKQARVAIDIGDIYQWLGDFERAKEEIEHAETVIRPLIRGDRPTKDDLLRDIFKTIQNIHSGGGDPKVGENSAELYRAATEVIYYHGLISKGLREWEEAERCFREVFDDYEELGVAEAVTFQTIQIKIERGEYAEALNELTSIAPVFQSGPYRPKLAALLNGQARCLLGTSDYEHALEKVTQGIQDLENYYEPDLSWKAHWLAAQIHEKCNDQSSSLSEFAAAIATVAVLRKSPLGYRLDSTFLNDKVKLFEEAIGTALRSGASREAAKFIEVVKSRTVTAVLSIPKAKGSVTDSNVEREFDLVTRDLDSIEFSGYREGWTAQKRHQREEQFAKRAELMERIRISDPRWRNLSEPLPFDIDRLAAHSKAQSQAILSLYRGPDNVTAVLVNGDMMDAGTVCLTANTQEALEEYAANLRLRVPDTFKNDFSKYYSIGPEQLVPKNLLARAIEADSLIIVPHGIFHLVPWATLNYQGTRLFEHLPVAILPNMSVVQQLVRDSTDIGCVAIVGVPDYSKIDGIEELPGAVDEIADVTGLYKDAGVAIEPPISGADATEAAFWKVAAKKRVKNAILHASCHGTLIAQEPMSSGLLMTDSKVDAAEIARNGLNFDEVVLSACSTGWRPSEVNEIALTGDEALGIPASLLEAGVRTVLASVPKAEANAARAFTVNYHKYRTQGHEPLRAYRDTQLEMLNSGEFDPSLWAGFVLYSAS